MTTKISTDNIQPNTVVSYSEFSQSLLPKVGNVSIANSSYTILDDTAVNVGGGYIVVTGGGFQDGATIFINETQATSVSYINSSILHAQIPAKSAATYNLYIVNPDGGTAIGANKLTYSGSPTWITDTALPGQSNNTPFNLTFSATGATSYSNTTEIPVGTELISNGYFYGTITVPNNTTYNFTIRATDDENQDSDKNFSLDVVSADFIIDNSSGIILSPDYTFSSNAIYYIVPGSNLTLDVKMWGGGGSAIIYKQQVANSGSGGGGGAANGRITLYSGNSYYFVVGGGGGGTYAGTPGGGAQTPSGYGSGGYTGIFVNSISQENAIMIAGGGGSGPVNDDNLSGGYPRAGAGGGTNGADGQDSGYVAKGSGGTQIAGGAAGTSGTYFFSAGTAGSALQGGAGGVRGPSGAGGGSGGGGYWGGGGAAGQTAPPTTNPRGAAGGGGSGYLNPSLVTNGFLYAGSFQTPGLSSDPNRQNAGSGGNSTFAPVYGLGNASDYSGKNGLIYIQKV
jgi:hypothetical protein